MPLKGKTAFRNALPLFMIFLGVFFSFFSAVHQVSLWIYVLNSSRYENDVFLITSAVENRYSSSRSGTRTVVMLTGTIGGKEVVRSAEGLGLPKGKLEFILAGLPSYSHRVLFAKTMYGKYELNSVDFSILAGSYKENSLFDVLLATTICNSGVLAGIALLISDSYHRRRVNNRLDSNEEERLSR